MKPNILGLVDLISLSSLVGSFLCTQLLDLGVSRSSFLGPLFLSALHFALDGLINSHDFTYYWKSPKVIFPALILHLRFTLISLKLFDIYTWLAPGYLKIIMSKLTLLTYLLYIHTPNSRNNCKNNYLTLSHSPHQNKWHLRRY